MRASERTLIFLDSLVIFIGLEAVSAIKIISSSAGKRYLGPRMSLFGRRV